MANDSSSVRVPQISLHDGHTIPQLGFGVFQIDPDQAVEAVLAALRAGYRHIDTAEMYRNEQQVGEAIKRFSQEAGVGRDAIFITSKLNNGFHKPDEARQAFADSLQKLGVDYIDLFLIHWPLPTLYKPGDEADYVNTWKTLIEFKKDGKAKSVGVSNFQIDHLDRLAEATDVVPAVNQIEIHPYFQNRQLADYCQSKGIAVEAWSPIAQGQVLDDPVIKAIAQDCGKTAAQVTLRWHIQKDYIVFPKSVTPERVVENFNLFDFELTGEQMDAIDKLDRGEAGRHGPNPSTFDKIP